jgi:hypothetical protein
LDHAFTLTGTGDPEIERLLTVGKSGTGNGNVISSPAGINCGADCSESFVDGTAVTLATTSGEFSSFAGWFGACTGKGPCIVIMDAAKAVSAGFALVRLLTVGKSGEGKGTVISSPVGINCGTDCSENFVDGTAVTLTAISGESSTFAGWLGACTGEGPCVVTMDAAKAVNADFAFNPGLDRQLLTVGKSGNGRGTVISNPAGINCGSDCSESFVEGTAVTLTAVSGGSSTFAGWFGACTGKGPCVVIMDAAKIVTARFARALGPPVPSAPTSLTATAISQQQVLLTWHDNSTNEDTFRIEMRRGNQDFREVATVGANVTRLVISNLRSDTRYSFRIRARNTFGFSSYSNGIIVRTPR